MQTQTFTVGLLVDATGIAASGQKHVEDGMKAAISIVAKQGYDIKYVVADTQSSPAGALTAAKNLVQRKHVFAVIAHSALLFAAAPYLTSQHIPVIGGAAGRSGVDHLEEHVRRLRRHPHREGDDDHRPAAEDARRDQSRHAGLQHLAELGGSRESRCVVGRSVGLKAGYVNAKFPFGSTDVGPAALAMKDAGIDAIAPEVDPNTSFALITALRNEGVNLKVALLPTGYGADLDQTIPACLRAAQNVYFGLQYQPTELHTKATETLVAALKATGGVTDPGCRRMTAMPRSCMLVAGIAGSRRQPDAGVADHVTVEDP